MTSPEYLIEINAIAVIGNRRCSPRLKRKSPRVRATPIADIVRTGRYFRFGSIADLGGSFDHLVGDRKQLRWNR
jgi:hypothetical protein